MTRPAASSRCSPRGPIPGSARRGSGARNAASRPGRDDEDAAGLAVIARDLGHRLARAAAEGAREAGRIPHRGLQGAEQRPCIGRLAHEPARGRGSPRRCRPARSARRGSRPRPRPCVSVRGSAPCRAGRRSPWDSAGRLPRRSWPSGCRTSAPRSSPSRPRRGCADRHRPRQACHAAPGGRAAPLRQRTRRGRGARSRVAGTHGRDAGRHRLAAREDRAHHSPAGQPDRQPGARVRALELRQADSLPHAAEALLERDAHARERARPGDDDADRAPGRRALGRPRRSAGRAGTGARCTVPT